MGWGGKPRETEKGKNTTGNNAGINGNVGWKIGHTLAEVEELLKKEKQKKN